MCLFYDFIYELYAVIHTMQSPVLVLIELQFLQPKALDCITGTAGLSMEMKWPYYLNQKILIFMSSHHT